MAQNGSIMMIVLDITKKVWAHWKVTWPTTYTYTKSLKPDAAKLYIHIQKVWNKMPSLMSFRWLEGRIGFSYYYIISHELYRRDTSSNQTYERVYTHQLFSYVYMAETGTYALYYWFNSPIVYTFKNQIYGMNNIGVNREYNPIIYLAKHDTQ